jgi:cell division protein ZapA
MAQVTVTVNNVSYTLGCDDGDEAHLTKLAKQFDKRVAEVKKDAKNASEAQLLVMAGLLLEDDLAIAADRIADLEPVDEEKFATLLESAARRMEDIAARLG